MKKLLSKLFINKSHVSSKQNLFKTLKDTTQVSKIFDAIRSYSNNSEILYVGGCVRKILSNEKFDDIDLATNLIPNEIKEALEKKNIDYFETGIDHGTITAHIDGKNFEITTLRKDIETDGRHAKVKFSKDWKEDSLRRDFSINSIYADIDGNLFDPNMGVKDIKEGKIRFIGDPELRIKEDYLRILRYLRFFLQYSKENHNLKIKKLIKQNINGITSLSKERLLQELKKITFSKSFLNIFKHNFSKELILLVFPQLVNINDFKKLNNFAIKNISKKDFTFLMALLTIDETDNAQYFLYKYNVSNETKKRINFLKKAFDNGLNRKNFSKNNLQKIFYYDGKSNLTELIDFYLFKLKKNDNKVIKLRDYFEKKEKPFFPIKTKEIMEKYNLSEGKDLGNKLKNLEEIWVKNNFKISKKEMDKVFLS